MRSKLVGRINNCYDINSLLHNLSPPTRNGINQMHSSYSPPHQMYPTYSPPNHAQIHSPYSPPPHMLDSGILPFRTSSIPDFQVERSMKSLSSRKQAARTQRLSEVDRDDAVLRDHVARLFEAKHRPFTTGGCIPMDPSQLVLFFRSKVDLSLSLALAKRLVLTSLPDLERNHPFA